MIGVRFYANRFNAVRGTLRPNRMSFQLEMCKGMMKRRVDSTALYRQRQGVGDPGFSSRCFFELRWCPEATPDTRVWSFLQQHLPGCTRDHGEPSLPQGNLFARLPAGEITLPVLRARCATPRPSRLPRPRSPRFPRFPRFARFPRFTRFARFAVPLRGSTRCVPPVAAKYSHREPISVNRVLSHNHDLHSHTDISIGMAVFG